jgi:hypothetical protein
VLLELDDYMLLESLDIQTRHRLSEILIKNGASTLTSCPNCGCFEFGHISGCSLDEDDAPVDKRENFKPKKWNGGGNRNE